MAAWLLPARWLFWLWIVPGAVNGAVLTFTDIPLQTPLRVQYVSLSVIAFWFGLATESLIYWFAPSPDRDPRPRYRRMYRLARVYPVFGTLVLYAIGCSSLWLYIYMLCVFVGHT